MLVKEIQKHPVNDNLISIGLYQVDENRKIVVEVPVTFIGEAPAVKLNLGFIIHNMSSIAVYCLPKDLPSGFEIDITKLEKYWRSRPARDGPPPAPGARAGACARWPCGAAGSARTIGLRPTGPPAALPRPRCRRPWSPRRAGAAPGPCARPGREL